MRIGWFLFAILVFEASALPRTHRGPRLEVSPASIAGTARKQTLQQHVMSIRGGRDKASRGPMPPDDGLDDGDFVFQTEEELREGKVVYAFLKAAADNHVSLMRTMMIDDGARVNCCDYDNRTALHIAAAEGHVEAVKFLLMKGANTHLRDRFGFLPLDDAVRGEHGQVVVELERAMTGGTLKGAARGMYTQLLMRDTDRFMPSWGEMLDGAHHSHVIAYDTENCAKGQIIEYDPAYLSLIGWLTKLKGTIFLMPVIHLQSALLLGIACTYAFLCRVPTADSFPVFPVFKGGTFGVSLVGGLLGFLLALFNANGLDRWWQTRMQLGAMMGQLTDLALLVGTYVRPTIPDGASDVERDRMLAEAKKDRETLIRWANLLHILVYRQARNIHDIKDLVLDTRYHPARVWLTEEEWGILQGKTKKNWEEGKEAMRKGAKPVSPVNLALDDFEAGQAGKNLTQDGPPIRSMSFPQKHDEEFEKIHFNRKFYFASQELIPAKNKLMSRYMIVLYWMERLFSKMSMDGTLSKNRPEALWKLQTCTNNIRTATSTVFTYLYCKIPYIYIQLLTFMVKLYLVVIAVIAGSNMRVATSHIELLLPIFLVIVSNCAYEGLLQIHVRLWNPLGMDTNSFPVTKYLEYVWKTTHQQLEDDEAILPKACGWVKSL